MSSFDPPFNPISMEEMTKRIDEAMRSINEAFCRDYMRALFDPNSVVKQPTDSQNG